MEIKEIAYWLRGSRDYEQGKALYSVYALQYGSSPTLSALLKAKKPSKYSLKKLVDYFEKIQSQVREDHTAKIIPQKYNYSDIDVSEFPESLQEKRSKIKELFSLRDQYKGQLRNIFYLSTGQRRKNPDKVAARETARKAVLNDQSIEHLWEQLRYYEQNKELQPNTGQSDDPLLTYLFDLADNDDMVKQMLFNYAHCAYDYNMIRNEKHLKDKSKLPRAKRNLELINKAKETYGHRYK